MAKKPCILVVEDDPNSRALISRILSLEFEVISVQNGLEALNVVKRRVPDLVLTDMNLPDLNGQIVASRVRAILGEAIPIVAISAQTDMRFKRMAMAAGCVGYIPKPIDAATINERIRAYLDGRVDRLEDGDQKRGAQEMQAETNERLEKTVRQLQVDNAELRSLEQAKTAFLVQVSHELRTPLTVLSGYVQMLNQQLHRDTQIGDFHRELSDMTIEGVDRLRKLMNEIVVLTRLASNQLDAYRTPMRIEPVALEAIDEFQEAFIERQILFESSGDGWQQVLMADATLIRMAFSNLLSNAIKFTPDGGRITMGIEREYNTLHITMQDTGVGIAADQMPLLFKPFFTAIDVSRGRTSKTQFMGMGMGMGLTIVTKIAEAHKGQVWAESVGYDEQRLPGSTFHLLLPLQPEQSATASTDATATNGATPHSSPTL